MTTTTLERVAPPRASRRPALACAAAVGAVAAASAAAVVLSARPAAAAFMANYWPFVNVALSIGLVIVLISVVRLHAFLALLLAALSAGFMAAVGKLPGEPGLSHGVAAVELTASEFGTLASKVGIVIALASIIGTCLLESGAADKVVRRFLALFGEKHAGLALLLATYVVSIPIFFETIFMLLVPLAQSLRRRTGKDYLLYLMAICGAGAITHTMVIPHPGPAALAGALHLDAGLTILVGLSTGLLPLAAGWVATVVINRRVSVAAVPGLGAAAAATAERDVREDQLPPLFWALLPILLPILLIGAASAAVALGGRCPGAVRDTALFLGNRHVALLLGTIIAAGVWMRQRGLGLAQVTQRLGQPLELAAVIILIICAGGSFGAALKAAGIGEAIAAAAKGHNVNLILLAYGVAALIRIAQGSVTVAMITTASIVYPMMQGGLPYHPVYVFMAIGYGALFVSWMNDGGFWVVSRLGGLSEKETLASWTVLTGVLSVAGLVMTYALSVVLPAAVR